MDLALIGTVAFGAVWIVNFYANKIALKFFKKDFNLDTTTKLVLMGVLAFVFLQVPPDLGSKFLNDIKIVVGIVTGATALYQAPKGILRSLNS